LQNYELILQTVKNPKKDQHEYIKELLDCELTHWECTNKSCFKSIDYMITTKEINIYNQKIETFIALIFDIYNEYMNIYSKRYNTDIDDSKIDNQKNLILELIFKILSDEDKIDFLIKYPHLIFKLIFQSEYKILSIFSTF
jgi:hypothetical protein